MSKRSLPGRMILCVTGTLFASPALAEEAADTNQLLRIMIPAPKPAQSLPASTIHRSDPGDPDRAPVLETGEFLRGIPGVSSSRAGGHGFEPVIRGQQQNQLTVIDNGAQLFGACPGRMDPPTSLARPGSQDSVTVIRGYQTVTNGPGASGGTILLDRQPPDLDEPISGSFWSGVDSNGDGSSTGLGIDASAEGFYASIEGSWTRSNSYEDGAGDKVRSGFRQVGGDLLMGREGLDGSFLEVGLSRDRVSDALFNGMMDSPETDTVGGRARGRLMVDGETLRSIEGSFYANRVDHVMDNYSLRDPSGMYMKTVADSDTMGGRLAADLDLLDTDTVLGLDGRTNNRQALGYMGMMPTLNSVRTYSWPDITINEVGLFGESTLPLTQDLRLTAGARVDFVHTTAGKADAVPTTMVSGAFRTANSLYRDYYGTSYDDHTEVNLGGLVRVEKDVTDRITLNGGLSRSVRTADATERGIASGYGAAARVGNPDIDPEKHHQLDIGATWTGADTASAFVATYINRVDDYILADRARGEYGVLRSDGAMIYHNTDALIAGVEVGGAHALTDLWRVEGSVAWTYGENLESGLPLPQMPPLSGSLGLIYDTGDWSLGGTLHAATKQGRADTDATVGTGQDVRETPGWMTLDLHGTVTTFEPVEIGFGVTNLLDATYAHHLNKPATFEPNDIQVNEPGRSVYLRMSARF
ncbi:TonB-dependent copper receptor [Marivibrio halodurans]|uniref:TonB-dependent copper receptor n=1 Tax=Marivibrio halodurans TaxID=2039722 RepID=A0A8J7V3M9_9PROT|nr:TonB-dependent copper receptor [Marivibrio halodurans]MBP5858431.1 TonB-dependent copper receptor [Marivibrio halodurans]